MKRVALYGDALILQNAGIHYYTLDFFRRIVMKFPDNKYFLVVPEPCGLIDGVEEVIVPIKKTIPFHQRWRQFIDIPRKLKSLNIDIAIEPAHFGPFNLDKQIHRVTVIHDLTPLKFRSYHKTLDVVMHQLLLPAILRRANTLVVNSNCTRKDLVSYFPEVNTKINRYTPSLVVPSHSNENVLNRLKISGDYCLSVGTIEPRKNHIELIKAFKKAKLPNTKLVIAGKSGWKNEALEQYFRNHPIDTDIIFTGYLSRDELMELYRNCSLFIYSSFYEGFGLPVLEAMSFNKAILTSNTMALQELGGGDIAYFDLDKEDDLAIKMKYILSDNNVLNQLSRSAEKRYLEVQAQSNSDLELLGSKIGLNG